MTHRLACILLLILVISFIPLHPARSEDKHYTMDMFDALEHKSISRDYIVHTPPAWHQDSPPALPVVLALHGGGGSAEGMQAQYGLDAYADRVGMIVVYANGVPAAIRKFHSWNAGPCCGRAKKENSNDVGFLSAVIDAVVKGYGADSSHVFVTGHSNGAMMAYRLACEIPNKIAAIAPVDGENMTECPHRKPVPILHIHGTKDRCVPYEGAESCGGCFNESFGLPKNMDDVWSCRPLEESLAAFAAAYGCGSETEAAYTDGPVSCKTWKNCPPPAAITLCLIDGGGHVWQGATPPPFCTRNPDGRLCSNWNNLVGPALPGVDNNRLIFNFFSRLAKEPRL